MTPPRWRALALALTLGVGGCDELFEEERPDEEALARAAIAIAAQSEEQMSDEPHGESIDDCMDRVRRETPASVQETIEAIGYEDLLRDSCRARVAEDERSVEPCRQIEARLVRRSCEARVAVASRDPGLCPSGANGHDPLCLALAARDVSLCRAAPHLEREACRELLGEANACDTSIAPPMCQELVARHRRRLGTVEAIREVAPATREEPELIVSFTRVIDDQPDEAIGEEAALGAFDRGGRIVTESGRAFLELADPLGLSVVSHTGHPSVLLRVPLPPPDGADDARLEARVGTLAASAEISHPDLGTLRADEGRVELTHLTRELGGRVEGRFTVSCPHTPGVVRVTGHFRTFLRDISGSAEDPLGDLERDPEEETAPDP